MLVASLGGLYLPHIRSRRSCLVISNAAGFSLSALAAAATVLTFGFGDAIAWPIAATCVVVAVSADWVVNSLIVGVATAVRSGDTITTSIRAQLVSDSDVFLLAIAVAALSALYVDRALLIQALYVCTALIAFEMRLKQRRVIEVQSSLTTNRYLNVSLIAVAAMLAWGDPGLGAVALVLFAVFLVQAADRMMLLPAVMAIAIAGVVAGCCSSARMPPIATAACVLAASFVVIEVAAVLARAKRSGRSLNGWVLVGLMMPGPRELAVLGLLAITISTAVPGDLIGVTSPAAIGLIFVMSTALASHLPNRLGRAICP
jgi:hypothetical protein